MHNGVTALGLWVIYAFLPYAYTIDCYLCTSLAAGHKECDDKFQKDITTEHLISRDCYYGLWKAHFCIKLKGKREDGSSILVRQCSVKSWGSHCGEIQFIVDNSRIEMIDGCLESCDFDGCNLATINYSNIFVICIAVILSVCGLVLR